VGVLRYNILDRGYFSDPGNLSPEMDCIYSDRFIISGRNHFEFLPTTGLTEPEAILTGRELV
jgi:hypothetical protein